MAIEHWFMVVGGLLILMALGSTVLKRIPLTTSMLYLALGFALGPSWLGIFQIDPVRQSSLLERLAELAVIVSLFAAGLKMRAPFSDARWIPPLKLATLAMMLSVGLVALVAYFALGLPLGPSILLGAILAPTDPVLASEVQVEHATDHDRLRFSLTGEAGMNDGTAFPFVMLGLGVMGLHDLGTAGWRWLTVDLVWAVVAGLGVGWMLGFGVSRLIIHLRRRHSHAVGYEDFLALGLIALAYGWALALHAYGFLAVFAAGLAVRHFEMHETGPDKDPTELVEPEVGPQDVDAATHEQTAPAYMARAVLGFSEQVERIAEVALVVILGGLLLMADWSWRGWLLAGALLLLIRPLSVLLIYRGKAASRNHRSYVAWFGVRGIGSIYYLMYAVSHGMEESTARDLVGLTLTAVVLSVVIHGITATPLMERYRTRFERHNHAVTGTSPAPAKPQS